MTEAQNTFLKDTALAAIRSQRETGVPASITIAQAILESGWGKTRLATEANNYFGIKDTNFCEGYAEFPTAEYEGGKKKIILAHFEKYPSPDLCFVHHARLLSQSKRYKPAMAVRNDPEKFAKALQDCGYSTLQDDLGKPIYAERLMQLVRQFNLTQYDISPDPPAKAKEQAA